MPFGWYYLFGWSGQDRTWPPFWNPALFKVEAIFLLGGNKCERLCTEPLVFLITWPLRKHPAKPKQLFKSGMDLGP